MEAKGFPGLDPAVVGGVHQEDEETLVILGEAKEGWGGELDGFSGEGRLEGASGFAPFEVGAMTGIDEIATVGAEVSQVEAVESVAAQLEDALDDVAVKVENLEATVLKDMGEVEKAVLDRVMELFGEGGEGFGEQSGGRNGWKSGGDFRWRRGCGQGVVVLSGVQDRGQRRGL